MATSGTGMVSLRRGWSVSSRRDECGPRSGERPPMSVGGAELSRSAIRYGSNRAFGVWRLVAAAWSGVGILLCAALLLPAPARADDPCVDPQGATALESNAPAQGSLLDGGSQDRYVFDITASDTLVTVTITDPNERLHPRLDSSCSIDEGGGGRHLDGGDWSRVGNDWQVSFDADEHLGEYFVTISPEASNTVFPTSYALVVSLVE